MTRVSVLMLPGWTNSGPEHWQSYWERAHPEYRRVEQTNWDTPRREDWLPMIGSAIDQAAPPVVLVAQSLGCLAAVDWAGRRIRRASAAWPERFSSRLQTSSGRTPPMCFAVG